MKILKLIALFILLATACVAQTPNSTDKSFGAGIDSTETIDIGGIKQVISIKGKDSTKPVLLYLHGANGSGASFIARADKLISKLQEHFVVVLWDQREYGKTLELNKSPQPLTLNLTKNDTHEVIEYLLKRFERKKLYLIGHSMGTVLGFHVAQKYPELLSAFVVMSPPVNDMESRRVALDKMKTYFKKINNQRAIDELATVQIPTTDFEQTLIQFRWQTEFDGEKVTDEQMEEIKPMLRQWEKNWGGIFKEISEMNQMENIPSLQCPVYFFAGRKDFQTNATITEKFYKKLKAPKKNFFWFEKSGHNLPETETALMQDIIINKILPATRELK